MLYGCFGGGWPKPREQNEGCVEIEKTNPVINDDTGEFNPATGSIAFRHCLCK